MSFTALDLTRKPGDMIQSEDWNETMHEIERLGKSKVDSVDGSLSGTLSIDEKLTVGSSENNLLIDCSKEGEFSMKTGNQSDQLVFGNGEERALTIRGNKVGIGTADPAEMLEVDGHVRAKPIIAQWYPTTHGPVVSGHHFVKWDKEVFNTNSTYLEKNPESTKITIKVSGYYRISAKILVLLHWSGGYSHLYLRKNNSGATDGSHIDMDHGGYHYPRGNSDFWYVRQVEYAGYFEAGEHISVTVYKNHVVGHLYHQDPWYTRLTISRIN